MKKWFVPILFTLLSAAPVLLLAQTGDPFSRYKVRLDLRKYPQNSPDKALASVVKTINEQNFDYLMAQLADPAYVDKKVAEYKKALVGPDDDRELVAFDRLAKEVRQHFQSDPKLAEELRKLAQSKEADWTINNDAAFIQLPGVTSRSANFKKIDERWYLENSQEPPK